MTTVRPVARFSIIRKSTRAKLTQRSGRKMSPDAATDVIADVTTDVTVDVNKETNKDAVDVGFCEEPFADTGELLVHLLLTSGDGPPCVHGHSGVTLRSSTSHVDTWGCPRRLCVSDDDGGELLASLSPLLFSMKVFGLYFHRENRIRRRTDDPEWNPGTTKPTTGSPSTKLRVYATVILVITWLNAIRSATMFTRTDHTLLVSEHLGAVLHMKITLFTFSVLTACLLYTSPSPRD